MTSFNFLQQWYPVALLEDLDPSAPKAITILGKPLVIWKPRAQQKYSVFLDKCPHRLAPLSEGRIDEKSDRLMCSYHGWEFDEAGSCQRIPQLGQPEILEKRRDNFCVVSFPVQTEQDLLWVWLDETTPDLAAEMPLPLSPNISETKGFVWSTYARDVDYDWTTLVENIVDPSHVPFAHHGLQGKREMAKPLTFEIISSEMTCIEGKVTSGFKTNITFKPPCLVEYEIPFPSGKQVGLVTYCVPTSPGKARLIAFFVRNFAKQLGRLIPRWWEHRQTRNAVIDSDMIILQRQEYFNHQSSESWKDAYKMPAEADRFVIEFRRWFDQHCEGKLPWESLGIKPQPLPIETDRPVVLDRYRQHTQHCSSCKGALKNTKLAKRILVTMAIASVAATAILPDAKRLKVGAGLLGFGGICGAIAAMLHYKLESEFYFIDYRHPEHK
ncbi:Pheophorbide a oxygenase [[Leptolyngbya] sp. PCC 7376]|uniref:aromatic ring-hydroxylating dioxygenase subunit alpha n=1 Tax=[Leptolyngbya] sp. PCC 7376 TaxID=111781 RepID=UPI00029F3572|nr:Rieske 2Fe-2S domain-containing protein [[Leptolyngbya] sp. PCC 7376]AFY39836.1 Pheophorbide a oxygenase [[Leptolyngbya] sp. PCC 7376]